MENHKHAYGEYTSEESLENCIDSLSDSRLKIGNRNIVPMVKADYLKKVQRLEVEIEERKSFISGIINK